MDGSSFLAAFASSESAKVSGGEDSSQDTKIQFNGIIDSFPVKGEKVTILPSPGDHEVGSSKLKITNIVNFGWEYKYYPGQLVTVHKNGDYFAYGIYSVGQRAGIVRVVHRKSGERVLLKGMKGSVQDLAFAHCLDQIILGVVDEWGNLFVYKIEENNSVLKTTSLLDITSSDYLARTSTECSGQIRRIIWCPYLPEDEDTVDDASSRLLALINGNEAQMWSVDMVVNEYGNGQHNSSDISVGKLVISDHKGAVTDATFSPDGTALATASEDGQVKFFQVYMHGSESPRCLHEWSPHDRKPVSSLFFLDNHKNYNPDVQFWKYVVTGAEKNSEIKIWSCETWECLQTVSFLPVLKNDPFPGCPPVAFKICLDLTSQFLLLSDINRKNIYVLQLQQESPDKHVTIVSVSEFATPSPILSMSILEAGIRKRADDPHTLSDVESDNENSDEENDEDNDADKEDEYSVDRDNDLLDDGSVHDARRSRGSSKIERREATAIKFLLVQPKSLQECRILYDDAFTSHVPLNPDGLAASVDIKIKTEGHNRSSISHTPELSSLKSPNIGIVKKEATTPSTASSSDITEMPPLAKIKQEPSASPLTSINVTDDLKIKTSSSSVNTPNRGADISNLNLTGTPSDRLQEAADKITLMSPEAFSSPRSHQAIKIKKEPKSPSLELKDIQRSGTVTSNASSSLATMLMNLASTGSSPSREVQDILAESEEKGGITADIVITEEAETDEVDDDEDEDEYKSPLDGDDEEDPLYDEDEEFKGKLEEYNPDNILANRNQPMGQHQSQPPPTELADLLNMIKNEKKPEGADIVIKPESKLKYEDVVHSTTANTTGANSSAWLSIVPKQELMEPNPSNSMSGGVDPLASPLSALMAGNSNVNRSFENQNESLNAVVGGATNVSSAPIIYGAPIEQLQSAQHNLLLSLEQQMQSMTKTMSSMASLIQTQRAEIQILREEVRTLATEDSTRIESIVKDAFKDNATKIEDASKKDNKALLSSLTQTLNTTVSSKMELAVKKEVRKLGTDLAKQTSQTIEKQLMQDSQVRAGKCDQAMREAISKLPHSKPAMEQLGQVLAQSITPVLQSSFREVFTTAVIPGFDRATQNLYANLATTFTKGTKEYENAMKNQLNKQAKTFLDSATREAQDAAREIQTSSTHSAKTIEAALKEFRQETRNLITAQQRLLSATPTGIHAGGNVTPNSGTPTNNQGRVITQQDVRMMLGRGQFNEAFQAALSAENLNLVIQTCEMVNPKQMFGQVPCPLAQSVLLSLIQHLGNHLHDKTELKHTYLEEAIMNLEPDNATTKAHIGQVTKQLAKQLQEYIAKHPHEKITRSMKMLLMATESLRKNTD